VTFQTLAVSGDWWVKAQVSKFVKVTKILDVPVKFFTVLAAKSSHHR